MIIIRSKRFVLRPLKRGDEVSIVKHINNPVTARNTLHIPYPYTMKDAQKWIMRNLQILKKKNKEAVVFAIEINGEAAGCVGLERIYGHSAEIGYWLGKEYWGQGIMTEAVKLVTNYAFRKLGLKRVYAFVFIFNKASAKVLKKAEYKYEGKLKKHAQKGNKLLDTYLFAKVI